METGELEGWASIFDQIESEDAKKELKAFEQKMGGVNLDNDNVVYKMSKNQLGATYGKFYVEECQGNKSTTIEIEFTVNSNGEP